MKKHTKKWYIWGIAVMMIGAVLVKDSVLTQASDLKPDAYDIILYQGNEQADGFITSQVTIKYKTAYSILKELKEIDVVASDVKANSLEYEGNELVLDLSEEFAADVSATGTSGEYIKVGSVVNTFIDAFGVDALTITINGENWESGHSIYDGPIKRFD